MALIRGSNISFAVKASINRLHERQDDRERYEEHKAILDWLTPIDYAPQQNDFIARRQKGTGQWLIESEKFQEWLNKSGQTLFCAGIPGVGKTMITAIVVDHLSFKFQNDASVGTAYLYCNFRRQQEGTSEALLLSLLKQLIQGQPSVSESVKNLYEYHKLKRTRPSLDEISKALYSVITGYSRAFIIIDALDECRVSDGGRKQLLSEISNLQSRTGVSLFATSRLIPDIMKGFEGRSISLEIRASPEDLRRYLGGHMSSLPSFVLRSPGLQEEVQTDIIKAVEGMYVPSHSTMVG
jgi:NACHT domain